MKKILLLADSASSHTQKWAVAVKSLGYDVMIFSFTKPANDEYNGTGILLASDKNLVAGTQFNKSDFQKTSYIKQLRRLKKIIREFKPDLVHAHYATSYGLMAALSGFRPYLVSVWGSDIFDFPKRSFFHKQLLKFNLKNAERVISSSRIMAEETGKYYNRKIEVIPFGIDTEVYKRTLPRNKVVTIGIIKSMEDHYGIESLIRAFKIVVDKFPHEKLKLLLIGSGTRIDRYRSLVSELNISSLVEFRGKIPQQQVPAAHNEIDIFVNPSVHESFGVSVLEASATENPVIATSVGGLKEVVVDGSTGRLVRQNDLDELVTAISYFVENKGQIDITGKKGRKFVIDNYEMKNVFNKISNLYLSFLKG